VARFARMRELERVSLRDRRHSLLFIGEVCGRLVHLVILRTLYSRSIVILTWSTYPVGQHNLPTAIVNPYHQRVSFERQSQTTFTRSEDAINDDSSV
jgi:hypothetical protein